MLYFYECIFLSAHMSFYTIMYESLVNMYEHKKDRDPLNGILNNGE